MILVQRIDFELNGANLLLIMPLLIIFSFGSIPINFKYSEILYTTFLTPYVCVSSSL